MLPWVVDKLIGLLIFIRIEYRDAKDDAGENITEEAVFDAAIMNSTPYVI